MHTLSGELYEYFQALFGVHVHTLSGELYEYFRALFGVHVHTLSGECRELQEQSSDVSRSNGF